LRLFSCYLAEGKEGGGIEGREHILPTYGWDRKQGRKGGKVVGRWVGLYNSDLAGRRALFSGLAWLT
jgi:hypothetical protein